MSMLIATRTFRAYHDMKRITGQTLGNRCLWLTYLIVECGATYWICIIIIIVSGFIWDRNSGIPASGCCTWSGLEIGKTTEQLMSSVTALSRIHNSFDAYRRGTVNRDDVRARYHSLVMNKNLGNE